MSMRGQRVGGVSRASFPSGRINQSGRRKSPHGAKFRRSMSGDRAHRCAAVVINGMSLLDAERRGHGRISTHRFDRGVGLWCVRAAGTFEQRRDAPEPTTRGDLAAVPPFVGFDLRRRPPGRNPQRALQVSASPRPCGGDFGL
jgi:hypothetical protein